MLVRMSLLGECSAHTALLGGSSTHSPRDTKARKKEYGYVNLGRSYMCMYVDLGIVCMYVDLGRSAIV
jgi:hypothetical protein